MNFGKLGPTKSLRSTDSIGGFGLRLQTESFYQGSRGSSNSETPDLKGADRINRSRGFRHKSKTQTPTAHDGPSDKSTSRSSTTKLTTNP